MKPKTIILMVIAIACGLGASYMTSQLIANRGEVPPPEVEKVSVLVAKKDIDMGSKLKEEKDFFEFKEFIKGQEPEQAVKNFSEIKDKYLKIQVRKGNPVRKDDVNDTPTRLPIPPGHQAMGLRVNMESSASGFSCVPGNRVDILWTRQTGSDDQTACTRLLENVLVLAADTETRPGENTSAMPAQVITVALTPDETLKVTLAKKLGTVDLSLRTPGDTSSPEYTKVTAKSLYNGTSAGRTEKTEEEQVAKIEVPPTPPVVNNPANTVPDLGSSQFKKHVVKIHTPEGVRTVTFLQNIETGKWVSEVSDDENAVPDLDSPPASVQPPVPPQPSTPAVAPKEEEKPSGM